MDEKQTKPKCRYIVSGPNITEEESKIIFPENINLQKVSESIYSFIILALEKSKYNKLIKSFDFIEKLSFHKNKSGFVDSVKYKVPMCENEEKKNCTYTMKILTDFHKNEEYEFTIKDNLLIIYTINKFEKTVGCDMWRLSPHIDIADKKFMEDVANVNSYNLLRSLLLPQYHAFGLAKCSEPDNFDKEVGIFISQKKAYMKMNSNDTYDLKIQLSHINALIDSATKEKLRIERNIRNLKKSVIRSKKSLNIFNTELKTHILKKIFNIY